MRVRLLIFPTSAHLNSMTLSAIQSILPVKQNGLNYNSRSAKSQIK